MRSLVFLTLILGLATANQLPTGYKLPVYGFEEYFSPTVGVHAPYSPFVDGIFSSSYSPYVGDVFGGGYFSSREKKFDIGLRELLIDTVVVLVKTQPQAGIQGGVEGYFLDQGLHSLAERNNTRFIYDILQNDTGSVVLVLPPVSAYNPAIKLLREVPVTKLEIPEGINLFQVLKASIRTIPYVLILDVKDLNNIDAEGLIRFGSLDIKQGTVTCSTC